MKVKYTIETSWSINGYEDELEFDDDEFEGYTDEERDKSIEEAVSDAVNNIVSWGFEVIK